MRSPEIVIGTGVTVFAVIVALAVGAEVRQANLAPAKCIEASPDRLQGLTDLIIETGAAHGYNFGSGYSQEVAGDLQQQLHREGTTLEQWQTVSVGVTLEGEPLVAKIGTCEETMPGLPVPPRVAE